MASTTCQKSGVLRRAVQAAAVVHTFDTPLLRHLRSSGASGPDDEEDQQDGGAGKALRALDQYGLAQVAGHPTPGEPGRAGIGEGYRLPEFIRFAVTNDLIKNDDEWWKELHARAASYYRAQLEQNPAEVEIPDYGQWRRYEKPQWQSDKREWLYHASQLEDNRSLTRAHFALVFLEAFYWWGCYHEFAFIWRLIEDWNRAARSSIGNDPDERENDQKMATALRRPGKVPGGAPQACDGCGVGLDSRAARAYSGALRAELRARARGGASGGADVRAGADLPGAQQALPGYHGSRGPQLLRGRPLYPKRARRRVAAVLDRFRDR